MFVFSRKLHYLPYYFCIQTYKCTHSDNENNENRIRAQYFTVHKLLSINIYTRFYYLSIYAMSNYLHFAMNIYGHYLRIIILTNI